jgi:tetratricopeptide (TPR) repeat protein
MAGHILLGQRDFVAALACFNEALSWDQLKSNYWLHRALVHINLDDFTKAVADLDHALLIDTNNADLFVLRGQLQWKLKHVEDGSRDLKMAHRLNPEHPQVVSFEKMLWEQAEAVYEDAGSAMLGGDFRRAIRLLGTALDLNPGDVKMTLMRASAYRQLGELRNAMNEVEAASKEYRTRLRASAQAQLMILQQQQVEAEAASKATSAVATSSRTQAGSRSSRRNKTKELTIAELEAAEAAAANAAAASAAAAEAATAAASSIIVDHPEIVRQRNLIRNDSAVNLFIAKKYKSAIVLLNKIIESETAAAERYGGSLMDGRFFSNRGDCHLRLGQLQLALADFHRALVLSSEDWAVRTRISLVHNLFGIQLFNACQYAEAAVEFSNAIAFNDRVALYFLHRGNTAYYRQRYSEAFGDYKRAQALDPDHPELVGRLQQFASAAMQQDMADEVAERKRAQAATGTAGSGDKTASRHGGNNTGATGSPPLSPAASTSLSRLRPVSPREQLQKKQHSLSSYANIRSTSDSGTSGVRGSGDDRAVSQNELARGRENAFTTAPVSTVAERHRLMGFTEVLVGDSFRKVTLGLSLIFFSSLFRNIIKLLLRRSVTLMIRAARRFWLQTQMRESRKRYCDHSTRLRLNSLTHAPLRCC